MSFYHYCFDETSIAINDFCHFLSQKNLNIPNNCNKTIQLHRLKDEAWVLWNLACINPPFVHLTASSYCSKNSQLIQMPEHFIGLTTTRIVYKIRNIMRELLSESLRGWSDKTVVKQTKKQTNKSNKGMLLKLYQ